MESMPLEIFYSWKRNFEISRQTDLHHARKITILEKAEVSSSVY